jgi:hypothetical protein
VVAIARDGRVGFDTGQVTPKKLTPAIGERLVHGVGRKVYIRADNASTV